MEHLKGASIGQARALPTNIRLGWKGLPVTNARAFYEKSQLTHAKSCITLATKRFQVVVCSTDHPLSVLSIELNIKYAFAIIMGCSFVSVVILFIDSSLITFLARDNNFYRQLNYLMLRICVIFISRGTQEHFCAQGSLFRANFFQHHWVT